MGNIHSKLKFPKVGVILSDADLEKGYIVWELKCHRVVVIQDEGHNARFR